MSFRPLIVMRQPAMLAACALIASSLFGCKSTCGSCGGDGPRPGGHIDGQGHGNPRMFGMTFDGQQHGDRRWNIFNIGRDGRPFIQERPSFGGRLVPMNNDQWRVESKTPPTDADRRVSLVTPTQRPFLAIYASYTCDSTACLAEAQPAIPSAQAPDQHGSYTIIAENAMAIRIGWWRYIIGQWPLQTTPELSGGAQYGMVTLPDNSTIFGTGSITAVFATVVVGSGQVRPAVFMYAPPRPGPNDRPDSGWAVRVWDRGSAASKLIWMVGIDVPQEPEKAAQMIQVVYLDTDATGVRTLTEPKTLDPGDPTDKALIDWLRGIREKVQNEANLERPFVGR